MFKSNKYSIYASGVIGGKINVIKGDFFNINSEKIIQTEPSIFIDKKSISFDSEVKCYNNKENTTLNFKFRTDYVIYDSINLFKDELSQETKDAKLLIIELEFIHLNLMFAEWRNFYKNTNSKVCLPLNTNLYSVQKKYLS